MAGTLTEKLTSIGIVRRKNADYSRDQTSSLPGIRYQTLDRKTDPPVSNTSRLSYTAHGMLPTTAPHATRQNHRLREGIRRYECMAGETPKPTASTQRARTLTR